MIVLGIESTAHTLSVGITHGKEVLSNVIDTYSGGKEGLIPRKMADHHSAVLPDVLSRALEQASVRMDDVDLIAFSQGPGIGAPLSVGVGAAKYLALRHSKPLIGVNHCYAHARISELLCHARRPLILYLSGGNSQLLIEDDEGFYSVLGETLDTGIGNLFDSFARTIGLEKANGAELARIAEGGRYIELPYTVKGMNLAFSGIQTAAERLALKSNKEDAAFSLMETAFAMSCEVAERALFLCRKKHLIACGGVAQNRRLQEMLKGMCEEAGARFSSAPDEFNRDNGAMIAYAGSLLFKRYGPMDVARCVPITNYRVDRMKEIFSTKSRTSSIIS